MKPLLVGILSLLSTCLVAQTWIDLAVVSGLKYTSGYHRGRMDAAMFHTDAVLKVSPWYDDPSTSWANKWATGPDGQPLVGQEKFWGSSRWFVAWTDDWHMDNLIRNQTQNVSTVYLSWATDRTGPMRNWYEDVAGKAFKKKPLWAYLSEYALFSLADSAGFYTTYNIIYK